MVYLIVVQNSTSARAPNARPVVPNALRAGNRFFEKQINKANCFMKFSSENDYLYKSPSRYFKPESTITVTIFFPGPIILAR